MTENDFRNQVLQLVHVSNPMILQAKQFLTSSREINISVEGVLDQFTLVNGKKNPLEISFHDSPTQEEIEQTAQYISYGLAFCEAVWSLIHNGYFFGALDRHYNFRPDIKYTRMQRNSSSTSSVIFELSTALPIVVTVMHSKRNNTSPEFVLFNPELYVKEIGTNLHVDVQNALEDSVSCFQQELYRPAVTQLGKAVEGAWVELGVALYTYGGSQIRDSEKLIEKLKNETNFMSRVQAVVKLFESRHDIFDTISKESGVKLQLLKEISYWSDVVRDSRNAIHFGVAPIIPNTYEKVSVLLMSAALHLKALYKLKNQADPQ